MTTLWNLTIRSAICCFRQNGCSVVRNKLYFILRNWLGNNWGLDNEHPGVTLQKATQPTEVGIIYLQSDSDWLWWRQIFQKKDRPLYLFSLWAQLESNLSLLLKQGWANSTHSLSHTLGIGSGYVDKMLLSAIPWLFLKAFAKRSVQWIIHKSKTLPGLIPVGLKRQF